ncbi:MAG TPA: class I tRNA ligase family protein, partial [Spirochaetales bacterium]|nr:class I tRNA ligase family protein [Spirochaetales bacterium]
ANKIWNASRYILMNLDGIELVDKPALLDVDRWILHRLDAAAASVAEAIGSYRFNDAASTVYEFFWNDFCDWYLEATKLSTRSSDQAEKNRALSVLLSVLEEALRLLHPFLPFVTEEIYGKLPNVRGRLIVAAYPKADPARRNDELDARFTELKELVTMVRSLKAEFGIPPERKLRLAVKGDDGSQAAQFLSHNAALVVLLANAESFTPVQSKPEGSLALAGRGYECYAYAREAVDISALALRFRKEAEKENAFADKVDAKLSNAGFANSAPPEVIAKEREKLEAARTRAAKLLKYVGELE